MGSILLTSFTTWLPHQQSNAADDLLAIVQQQDPHYDYLRQLPVETVRVAQQVILEIEQVRPRAIICCGMAESRTSLSIEAIATRNQSCIQTTVNLEQLSSRLTNTYISYDAGKFVCEGLYFQVLNYLQYKRLDIPCIFVHVPLLTSTNKPQILHDFQLIIDVLRDD